MKLKCGKANVCAVPKECKRTDVYYFEIELTKGQQETDRNVYHVLGFFINGCLCKCDVMDRNMKN